VSTVGVRRRSEAFNLALKDLLSVLDETEK
jgi:hypothetical protein